MQPRSIRLFSWLYLLAIGLGLVVAALNWSRTTASLGSASAVGDAAPFALAFTLLALLLIPLLLWYFIVRRRSNVARWLVVALTALGVAVIAFSGLRGTLQFGVAGTLGILGVLLRVVASAQLFRPDAVAWFHHVEEASA